LVSPPDRCNGAKQKIMNIQKSTDFSSILLSTIRFLDNEFETVYLLIVYQCTTSGSLKPTYRSGLTFLTCLVMVIFYRDGQLKRMKVKDNWKLKPQADYSKLIDEEKDEETNDEEIDETNEKNNIETNDGKNIETNEEKTEVKDCSNHLKSE